MNCCRVAEYDVLTRTFFFSIKESQHVWIMLLSSHFTVIILLTAISTLLIYTAYTWPDAYNFLWFVFPTYHMIPLMHIILLIVCLEIIIITTYWCSFAGEVTKHWLILIMVHLLVLSIFHPGVLHNIHWQCEVSKYFKKA